MKKNNLTELLSMQNRKSQGCFLKYILFETEEQYEDSFLGTAKRNNAKYFVLYVGLACFKIYLQLQSQYSCVNGQLQTGVNISLANFSETKFKVLSIFSLRFTSTNNLL